MKDKIERFSKGIFEYEQPEIILSQEVINIFTGGGGSEKGSFTISNSKGTKMKGILYSSSKALTLFNTSFNGIRNEIVFSVNTEHAETGERIEGRIDIVSDCGEKQLPFMISVSGATCRSSIGNINNFFSFQSLAQSDWNEAAELFDKKDFYGTVVKKDRKLLSVYDALSVNPDRNIALEQFLVSMKKKQPCGFFVGTSGIDEKLAPGTYTDKILITKSSWGYLKLYAESDKAFVSVKNPVIENSEFINGRYELRICSELNDLPAGVHTAHLRIHDFLHEVTIPVTYHVTDVKAEIRAEHRDLKKTALGIMKKVLSRFSGSGIGINDRDEASDAARELLERCDHAGYGLPEGVAAIMSKLAEGRTEPLMLFQAGRGICTIPSEMTEWLETLEDILSYGISSPFAACVAAGIILKSDDVLTGPCEAVCRIFEHMIAYDRVTEQAAEKFSRYAASHNANDRRMLRILTALYERFPIVPVLSGICLKVIGLDLRDEKWHVYFERAVEERLDFVNIFEYYLYTFGDDLTKPIAQPVLLYFGYNTALEDKYAEILYAGVILSKENNLQIYKAYFKNIEQFAVNGLIEKRISPAYAVIYSEVLRRELLDEKLVESVPDILFTYSISVPYKKVVRVDVVNDEETCEMSYAVSDGHADVLLYTDSCTCWLVDGDGNRFLLPDENGPVKYMHMQELLGDCHDLGSVNPRLALYMWEKNRKYDQNQASFITLRKQIAGLTNVRKEIENDCLYSLAEYYYDNYEGELLEHYLSELDLDELSREQRKRAVEHMIVRNMYGRVIEYVSEYGCEDLSIRRLSKLCMHAAEAEDEPAHRADVILMSHHAFRNGNVDDGILRYLSDHFQGTTLQMFEVWNAAKAAGTDTARLEENLLAQMLFTESYVEDSYGVFRSFYSKNINRKLVRAFISYTSYTYFVKERVTDPGFFTILKDDPSLENCQIGILALLKFYSEKDRLTDEEKDFSDRHMRAFMQKKMFFAFFRDFKDRIPLPKTVIDKYYVEYRTDPEKSVQIHYSFGEGSAFRVEPMVDLGYGIFSKEIILFHGEVLQYFITEYDGEDEEITVSNSVTYLDESSGVCDSKYDEINNILTAVEMRDEETIAACLEQFFVTEYAIKRHFKPL